MNGNGNIPAALKDHLTQAKNLAANRLLRPNYFANVVGVGIGKKVVAGDATPTYSVRVYVISKLELGVLSPATAVPSSFLGVPTDIIEVGRFGRAGRTPNLANGAQTPRPGSPISVQTNAPNVNRGFFGTLGAVVQTGDGAGDSKYILSCNHVMAVNGRVPDGAKIVLSEFVGNQQQLADPDQFVRLTSDGTNAVDCALAKLTSSSPASLTSPANTLRSVGVPALDMQVEKVGAGTGSTKGTIVDVDVDLYVDYSFGTFRFENQVMIDSGSDGTDFATVGDSGSLIVDTGTGQAVAMIFAGSGRFAVACPLQAVLQQLAAKAGVPKLEVAI